MHVFKKLRHVTLSHIFVSIFYCKWTLTTTSLTVSDEHQASLQDILRYSPFKTQEELLVEIDAIVSFGKNTGTRIVIWNLRRSVQSPLPTSMLLNLLY